MGSGGGRTVSSLSSASVPGDAGVLATDGVESRVPVKVGPGRRTSLGVSPTVSSDSYVSLFLTVTASSSVPVSSPPES